MNKALKHCWLFLVLFTVACGGNEAAEIGADGSDGLDGVTVTATGTATGAATGTNNTTGNDGSSAMPDAMGSTDQATGTDSVSAEDGSDSADTGVDSVEDAGGDTGSDEGTTGTDSSTGDADIQEPDAGPSQPQSSMVGCDGKEFLLPPGYTKVRLEPEAPNFTVDITEAVKVEFKVVGTLIGGAEKELDSALFLVSNTEVGQLGGNGEFNSLPGHGGVVPVKALIGTGCLETTVTVTTVAHHVVGENAPDPEWYDAVEPPTVNPASPVLLYPVAGAAWPRNLPPMVVQWTYDKGGASTVFRIDFAAPHARVHIYANHAAWEHKPGEYAAEIPPEAWNNIFTMVGGAPHNVSVVAGTDVNNGLADGLLASAPHPVTFTSDLFGGAVYYWNTKVKGIRVLDLAGKVPTVETVPITGGCHGCHATSPDGTTIAVSFVSGWKMKLHNVEDGKEADWIHPDAKAFLQSKNSVYPAFSNAYWNENHKHMLVSHGGSINAEIYSVDLLSGEKHQMTNSNQGLKNAQLFPAFARDGKTIVFATSDKGLTIQAKDEVLLWRMDYNAGLGAAPVPLSGAAEPGTLQYYPALTPDDNYVVFNRATANTENCPAGGKGGPGSAGTYDNCHADLRIVPIEGGESIRLDAASGPEGAGYANSFPSLTDKVSGSMYWVAFSSRRSYGVIHQPTGASGSAASKGFKPQIWVAAIDPDKIGDGTDPSFAPIWLPGQDLDAGNHIGQWSVRN